VRAGLKTEGKHTVALKVPVAICQRYLDAFVDELSENLEVVAAHEITSEIKAYSELASFCFFPIWWGFILAATGKEFPVKFTGTPRAS
jgi:hypothetical protein